jgi:hypothetical protein
MLTHRPRYPVPAEVVPGIKAMMVAPFLLQLATGGRADDQGDDGIAQVDIYQARLLPHFDPTILCKFGV